MPRPTLPPTPASSTDIKGKDGTQQLSTLQMSFELPPPAITSHDSDAGRPSPSETSPAQSKAAYPLQASETVKSRRRSSAAKETATKDSFVLPPPPTRSRKIIQMKPRTQAEPAETPAAAKTPVAGKTTVAAAAAAAATTSVAAPSKKKQPSATSAAGRKIARKTAHSLIERRRRSKMNEEFAVLKNMIPACTGEMHKLAILQASIEYVRYLEDCIAKLKAQREAPPSADQSGIQTPSGQEQFPSDRQHLRYGGDDQSGDVEMAGSGIPSPTFANPPRSHQSSISPALHAEDSRHRQDSYSSVSTDQRHYSYSASSATTSPAFGPQAYSYTRGAVSGSGSTLPSPALLPQRDLDQEATAALLMLNTDRRGFGGGSVNGNNNASGAGRGMSVRDLLST